MAGGAAPLAARGGPGMIESLKMPRNYVLPFCLVTSLFFAWGFAYGLLDVLNKHFQNVLNITKLQSTGLQVAYFGIGYFAFSPVAGEVLKRFGYKRAIIMGLALYSSGAILFWPVAHFAATSNPHAIFGGFVACTALTACGLATLEVTANSYVTVMPPSGASAFRLQFSQSFNGVASFSGPLIASKYFFSSGNSGNLTNVQFVYMAVAGLGVLLATMFAFTKLPEVSEEELAAEQDALAVSRGGVEDAQLAKPFYKQMRPILGFVAQFMYVGAQVTIGSFFINYVTENAKYSDSEASQLLSYGLIIFTVGRFVASALLTFLSASLLLTVNAAMCILLTVLIGSMKGTGGVVCIILIMFFESCQYPVIFVLSTTGLGRHTRRAAALLVMGVAGGAVFPPIQGAIADKFNTRVSFFICVPAFAYITAFAGFIWFQNGRHVLRTAEEASDVARNGPAFPQELGYDGEDQKAEDLRIEEYKQ